MRRVALFAVLGALLVTVAWWMFLISPRNGRIADLGDERLAAVDTEQRLRTQIAQLQDIRDREIEYLSAVGQLNALIPDQPLLDEFIEQISQLANDTGIELQAIAASTPAALEGSELREIVVSVQVQGEFFELLGFLFGLSDLERLVRVDAIDLASSQDETGATLLGVSLTMRLFTLSDLLPAEGVFETTTTTSTTVPGETTTTTTGGGG